ncbi:MAG TPA: RDD family protein [Candidatus Tumulicola sp.]|nr:RDD family protein [Candidatus Tumulicola sp.]
MNSGAVATVGSEVLFSGPASLRDPAERTAFWLTAICALPAALLIGYVLHESIGASQVALFIVIAMVYVTLARGRLLGSSVRVHETQYPRVFAIVKNACAALEIPMPLVFVREDNYVPVAALGFGEPYALVLSSHWIEVFQDDELAFMIGRELGHIAAGHTRFLSLLSVNGKENPLISLIFGGWLRRCTMTCDKVGLLCAGSIDAAIRAIGVAEFHEFGRKVDYRAFAEQHLEIEADTISRWGAWLGSEPYATTRIAALRRFIESLPYAQAQAWFMRERGEEPPALAQPGRTTVSTPDCAGWWRRCAAFAIDVVVVLAIINSFGGGGNAPPVSVQMTGDSRATPAPRGSGTRASSTPSSGTQQRFGPLVFNEESGPRLELGWFTISAQAFNPHSSSGKTFWFAVYMTVLVTIAGQSFGMMIAGLRVVTVDFRRPGIWRALARYAIVFVLWPFIVAISFVWRRVLLHDRWTRTRLVKVERVIARATGTA